MTTHEEVSVRGSYDTETLLMRVRSLVENGRSMPMSASALVNREELLELVDESIDGLPAELRQARWLLKEREEFLAQARRDAEDIIEAGRAQAERMVERMELVREARRLAQQTIDGADAQARQMRREAEDYVDQKLAAFEVVLERTMTAVARGRERLQAITQPDRDYEDDAVLGADSADFFDQGDEEIQL